jgi:hypothetical protein
MRVVGALVALLLLGAPAIATAQPVAVAQATLREIPLRLMTAKRTHRYSVELAATPREQQIGMMFRTRLARGRGMLFPFAAPRPLSFWMENTLISLDLVFVGADRRVLNVAARATPLSRAFLSSQGAAVAVLEIGAGEAARIGLRAGDRVEYNLP